MLIVIALELPRSTKNAACIGYPQEGANGSVNDKLVSDKVHGSLRGQSCNIYPLKSFLPETRILNKKGNPTKGE